MKKYGYLNKYRTDGVIVDGNNYIKSKTVYKKSKYEYIVELIDSDYNLVYLIILYGGYTKGPYKSRHHAIKLLNELPSYYYLNDLIANYYVQCCPFERAYRDIVSILVRDYGCLDPYSLYLINEVFSDVYNEEMR